MFSEANSMCCDGEKKVGVFLVCYRDNACDYGTDQKTELTFYSFALLQHFFFAV